MDGQQFARVARRELERELEDGHLELETEDDVLVQVSRSGPLCGPQLIS